MSYDKWGTATIEGKVVGRDGIVVPPQQVEDLAEIGCTNKEIANFFGVDDSTLAYNFKFELAKGRANLNQRLRRAQIQYALQGNATLLIWLGKNILSQSDTPQTADKEVLPFTDDELDSIKEDLEEELEDMKQEYNEIKE